MWRRFLTVHNATMKDIWNATYYEKNRKIKSLKQVLPYRNLARFYIVLWRLREELQLKISSFARDKNLSVNEPPKLVLKNK